MVYKKEEQAVGVRSAVDRGADNEPLILIAEDNDSNYQLLEFLLKEYRLLRARNGLEAVEVFGMSNPDVILMDIRMPLMDGLEATRQIRKSDVRTPIIALTAFAFEEDKRNAFCAGCNDYITKPLSFVELRKKINAALSLR